MTDGGRARRRGFARAAVLLVPVLLAVGSGCLGGGGQEIRLVAGEIPYRVLGPRTHRLEIDGADHDAVREVLGSPLRRSDGPVAYPRNGLPKEVPDYDEQWVYERSGEQTLVYFEDGRVVLAIHEWAPH